MTMTDRKPRASDVGANIESQAAGRGMKRISIARLIRRGWMVLVAVVVAAVATFGVYRLHGIFGSHNNTSAGNGIANDIIPFNPKRVVYEVFGLPGTQATINYLDLDGQPQKADHVALPWTHEMTTTEPAIIANLVAQGNSSTLGCRIIVDDVVKDERTVNEVNAYTFCLDKSG
jgi:hypothetical protein